MGTAYYKDYTGQRQFDDSIFSKLKFLSPERDTTGTSADGLTGNMTGYTTDPLTGDEIALTFQNLDQEGGEEYAQGVQNGTITPKWGDKFLGINRKMLPGEDREGGDFLGMGGGTLASIFKQVDRSVVKPVGQVVTKTGGFAVPLAFMAAAYAGGAMAADAAGADVLGAEAGTTVAESDYAATAAAQDASFGTGAGGASGATAAKGLLTIDNALKAMTAVNTVSGLVAAGTKPATPAGGSGVGYATTNTDGSPLAPIADLTGTAQTIGFENAKRKLLAARKTPSALLTGGLGDTSAAPVQKKTLLGE